MDAIAAIEILTALTPENKTRMLAMLCHDLTVIARDTYGKGEDVKVPTRLRALNEIEHRMTGFLIRILRRENSLDADDAIAAIFFGERKDKYLGSLLAFAFTRVSKTFQKGEMKGDTESAGQNPKE